MAGLAELQNKIDYHQDLYDDPESEIEITDPEFNQLKEELKVLAPDDPRLSLVAGASVGKSSYHRETVSHAHNPCYSLDKVYSFEDVLMFASRVARSENELFDLELKLDGLTGSLTNGVLATSGEGGIEGFDISDKLSIIDIEYAPGTENITQDLRGEIILKKSVFEKHRDLFVRSSNGKPYKVPRSAAVAQVMPEAHITSLGKFLTFVVFGRHQSTFSLAELRELDWEALANKATEMDYPTDGLVLKLHDREYLDSLGTTSHHKHGEIAYKFANLKGETVLLDIERSVGKGRITPVGIIKPVEIGGIMNSRVTLHNAAYIVDNDICIGDRISIERAGAIIPKFHKIVEKGKDRYRPDLSTCPACGGPTDFDGKTERCNNEGCTGTLSRQLHDSVVRVGIDTLGLTTVQKLIDKGCETLIDVFGFSKESALQLEGFAEISAKNLIEAIATVKNEPIEDWKILASLNITGIGRRMSKKILTDRTLADLQTMRISDLNEIAGIGPTRAALINVTLDEQREYLDQLTALFPKVINTVDQKGEVKGTVCFTGATPIKSETRDKFWEPLAAQNGYEVSKGVTANLSILVTGDTGSMSSKMKKARTIPGIQIIDYEAFRAMC